MASNRGNTSLKCKRRNENSMLEFDQLPRELRGWIVSADLPWRTKIGTEKHSTEPCLKLGAVMQMHLKS